MVIAVVAETFLEYAILFEEAIYGLVACSGRLLHSLVMVVKACRDFCISIPATVPSISQVLLTRAKLMCNSIVSNS